VRITKRTNIAIRLLMFCAVNTGRLVTKAEIAERCNVSGNHLAQVINQLGQLDFLATQRGRKGGMMLARQPEEIRIGEVFRAVEGDTPSSACFADGDQSCPLISACRLKGALDCAKEAFYAHLDRITLDQLVTDNDELIEILRPSRAA